MIKGNITKPDKIIPFHLQHNSNEWYKHHRAGKQKTNLKIIGFGSGIIKPKFNNLNSYICDICGKNFKSKKSLTNHRRWHDLPEYDEFKKNYFMNATTLLSEKEKEKMTCSTH